MSEPELENYRQKLAAIHKELGISADFISTCGLDIYAECVDLVETEQDVFSRQPLMEAKAYDSWLIMKARAHADGIELEIVSVYRSADYQKKLFLNKLSKGQTLSEILKVNAPPGFSEHHTGQAVDITCPGFEHLSETFEKSPAFQWLTANAGLYGFCLSFPRNNHHGFLYEPWHWKFSN